MTNRIETQEPCLFDPRWPVLYIDNHLLAVYKPAGLLVQGDRTGDVCLLDLCKDWLRERYKKPGRVFLAMVHRLDRPVAGVVLFARTSKAASRLAKQFRERSVEKRYLAVVEGEVRNPSGRLIHHIHRQDRASHIVPAPVTGSQEARLRYRVLETGPKRSLLGIELETGRRHQIRIQLAHAGHAILGDLRYGAMAPLANRQIALLAHTLSVNHPTKGDRLTLTCPIPQNWPWPDCVSLASPIPSPPWDWRAFDSLDKTN